jgi:hypothetical protein
MSENLRKLREMERITGIPYRRDLNRPLAGMSQIENLERQAQAKREEEQKVKEELKAMAKGAIGFIRRDFDTLIRDEKLAIEAYTKMNSVYGSFGWRKIFSDILNDEKEHLEKLQISLKAIDEAYRKSGDILSV